MRFIFCTNCGNRLSSDARFCSNCGTRVSDRLEGAGGRSYAGTSPLPGLKDLAPGLRDLLPGLLKEKETPFQSEETYAVCAADLNRLVDCSLMNAIMDTAFMLVCLTGSREWIPLAFLYDIEKCEIQGYASVRYILDKDIEPFCIPDRARARYLDIGPFLKHVHDSRKGPFLEITISPVFKPANYGSMDSALRGKWAPAKNEQGMNDVRAILQMPWSGTFLKQRLIKHAGEVEYDIRYAKEHPDKEMDDRQYQQYIKWLEAILSRLRSTVKQMPEGPPDHIFCVGSVSCGDQTKHTVVSESEDRHTAGELRPQNILKAIKESGGRGGGLLGSTLLSAWKPGPMPSASFRLVEGFPGRSSATLINNRLRTDIDWRLPSSGDSYSQGGAR